MPVLFLMVGEVCNMIGVALAVPLSMKFGKKSTYIISLVCLVVFSVLFFFVPNDGLGWWLMMIFQVLISICTGIVSPLIWSMYADVADYAEQKDGTSSTGLIFSSGSMAQKFGGAFAGWVSNGTVGILRLQYRRECRADSRGAGWLEVSDELYSCCDSRTFHRCRIHLSIE